MASFMPKSANLPLAANAPDIGTGHPKRMASTVSAEAARPVKTEAGTAERAAS
jgi:hypothetical protein